MFHTPPLGALALYNLLASRLRYIFNNVQCERRKCAECKKRVLNTNMKRLAFSFEMTYTVNPRLEIDLVLF